MISQKDYENLKEMYDYKRKIEYNKEKTKKTNHLSAPEWQQKSKNNKLSFSV